MFKRNNYTTAYYSLYQDGAKDRRLYNKSHTQILMFLVITWGFVYNGKDLHFRNDLNLTLKICILMTAYIIIQMYTSIASFYLRSCNQFLNAIIIQLLIVVSIVFIIASNTTTHLLVTYSSRLDDAIIIARFLLFVYLCKIDKIYSSFLILSKIPSPISR